MSSSGLGDRMAASIKGDDKATRSSARPAEDTTTVDDEYYDDGLAEAVSGGGALALTAIGETVRPNGQTYKPRMIGDHEDLALLRYFRDVKESVLFYGPPGTGKTAMCEASFAMDATASFPSPEEDPDEVASRVTDGHFGVESIVCSADTTEADFTGTWVQNPTSRTYEWAPGPLHRAVLNDVPLYVDEVFLADPRVLSSVLYPVMDGRNVLRIAANPNLAPLPVGKGFSVIASGNPDVPGAVVSEALRDRFDHHIEVTSDWELARELGVPQKIITVAKNLDKQRANGVLSWSPQLRSLLAFRDAAKRLGQSFAVRGLLGKTPFEDRPVVAEALEKSYGKATPLALDARDRKAGRRGTK